MRTKLKTLKDLEYDFIGDNNRKIFQKSLPNKEQATIVVSKILRQEAIKWIKAMSKIVDGADKFDKELSWFEKKFKNPKFDMTKAKFKEAKYIFMEFFNIAEEELK